MKKFALKSLYFALFFTLFFVIINFFFFGILVFTDEDFKKRIESIRFDNPDFDLLVLGTSFAQYGIDTELLTMNGIKSYNLAIAGNSYKTSYIQLNEYLTKYSQRPRYVLLALNSARELGDPDKIQPIIEVTMKNHDYCLKDAPILKLGWLGAEFLKKIISSKHRRLRLTYGQIKYEKCNPDDTDYNRLYFNLHELESVYTIGEIAKLCDQNGIQMIIVNVPGFKETQNLSEIGPYALHFINGYSAILYNLNSQDFCKIFDSKRDWIGNSHLNEFGAIKFTEELTSIIEALNTKKQ